MVCLKIARSQCDSLWVCRCVHVSTSTHGPFEDTAPLCHHPKRVLAPRTSFIPQTARLLISGRCLFSVFCCKARFFSLPHSQTVSHDCNHSPSNSDERLQMSSVKSANTSERPTTLRSPSSLLRTTIISQSRWVQFRTLFHTTTKND